MAEISLADHNLMLSALNKHKLIGHAFKKPLLVEVDLKSTMKDYDFTLVFIISASK